MGRPLSAVEEFVARTGTPVVLGATIHGPLDTDALAQAVQRLSDHHPVLTHRITRKGNRHHLTPAADQPPPHLRHTDEPVDTPFAPGDPLLRATLTPHPDGTHRLVLALHHAISDGVSALSVISSLWRTYTALVTGTPEPARPPTEEPLPATDDLLAERHPPLAVAAWLAKQAVHMALHRAARLPSHPASPSEPGVHLHTTELTTAQAHRLYRTAREHGTTPNALLCAIILLAARTQFTTSDRPSRLSLGVTVDLRRCVAMPSHHLVTATSFVPVTARVAPEHTATALAASIDRQFTRARATAHAERQAVALRYLLHAPTPIPYTMMLTNMATHPFRPTLPPDLHLTDAFGYAPPPGPLPAVFITRADGALALHLATPRAWFTADQATRLADALTRQLTTVLADTRR